MAKTEIDRIVTVPNGGGGPLDRYFKISERGSSVRTEIVAGVTTWLTMAYILFLNPQILGLVTDNEGTTLAFPQVLTVTALAAGVMTLAMGLWGRYPFAIAAGLGLNGFVAFTLVGALGLTWPQAMGVIVIEGLVISVLVLTNVRQLIMDAIPMDLKRAIAIGIGLFLAIIGFVTGGVVIQGEATPITIVPDLTTLRMATFVFGLVLAAGLVARKIRGGLLVAILVTTGFAIALNEIWADGTIWEALGPGVGRWPSDVVSSPDFALVGNFNLEVFSVLSIATALVAILSVMMADFFDTMGTAVGLGEEAGLLDEDGRLPGIKRVLLVDGLAAAAGGAASASSNTTFIESGAGIADGGRTGLASVVTGVLFLLCLFISPLAGVVPPEATAPVLVIVGFMMMKSVGEIDWRDPGIGIPAFLTMTLMPFTYNIAHGIAAGFLSYTLIRLMQGRPREVHWLLYAVDVLFVVYFVRGLLA